MNQTDYILLPANSLFIAVTLAIALLLDLLPWGGMTGVPDMVALVLTFWSIHQPRKVGMGIAFFMGLLMDVHNGALLGQNALAYTLLSYFATMVHRRVLWFPVITQTLQVLPLLLFAQLVQLAVRLVAGSALPGWSYFIESLTAAALWPLATAFLLAPQRRSADPDHTRPI